MYIGEWTLPAADALFLSPQAVQQQGALAGIAHISQSESKQGLYCKSKASQNIRGVEICSLTLSTLRRQCRTVRFKKTESMTLHGQQVHVQYNCFEVGIAQQILVMLKTIPDGNRQTMEYHVQAGKLDYSVDQNEKLVSVHVSEFPDDNDYHLRLCHKWHSCESTGAYVLIKKEDPVKKVTLPYSKLVPCLCIEGWSSIPDSSRIQLCPFKKNTEELWSGITYNPVSQELVWELACPIEVREFLGDPDGVVILVWSKGCNKPVIKNTCDPVLPNAMNSVPLKCVRIDIATYFRDTVKVSDIPSMFDAIPICKLKEHFTALMKQSWIDSQNAMVHHDLVLSLKGYRSRHSPKQLVIEIWDDSEFEDSVTECPDDEETLLR
ncbi:UNVERIFIED_CONTAM: hypothetical protein FKN15_069167 [Acipenser sinensis]